MLYGLDADDQGPGGAERRAVGRRRRADYGGGGDAKLLEISGMASNAVLEWVRGLREPALETAHSNRSSADMVERSASFWS